MKQEIIQAAAGTLIKRSINVQTGDTVKVYQRIIEGEKQRVQMFKGLVTNTRRLGSMHASITLRRVASGVGVEKSYLLNSPLLERVQIIRRSKVRRKQLTYIRRKSGKAVRLSARDIRKGILTDEVLAVAGKKEASPDTVAAQSPAEEVAVASEPEVPAGTEKVTEQTTPDPETTVAEDARS